MEGKLIKVENGYVLMVDNTMYATDNDTLSLKNCEAIENGYDLDELISYELQKLPYQKHVDDGQYNDGQLSGFELGAEWGFQKAIELLGDKKFSEEDMSKAWSEGYHRKVDELNGNGLRYFDKFIQSLQQTEWDVIIEMECPVCKEWGYISECRNNCNQKFLQPKLDADGCLILKRK